MTRFASVAALIAAGCAGAVVAVLLAAGPAGADAGSASGVVTTVRATLDTGASATPVRRPAASPTDAPTALPYIGRQPAVAAPKLLTAGISVGGTLVGGLTTQEARDLIQQRFDRPLTLVLSDTELTNIKRVRVLPSDLGAAANVTKALRTAESVRRQGFLVPLDVSVSATRVKEMLADVARQVERKPKDAKLVLQGTKPVVVDARPGFALDTAAAQKAIELALRTHSRDDVSLPVVEEEAKVQADAFHTAIVIQRGSNRLHFYVDGKLKRTFSVATGAPAYPTPLGRFNVINMQRNPWWYPPTTSAWAQGLEPVPPGPTNPLGTRWMGISSPNVGIHGTPNAASIGYSASHGCIRMLIPQVEWLFERVEMGTTVFIVAT